MQNLPLTVVCLAMINVYLDALTICLSRTLASSVLLSNSDMKLFFVDVNLHQAFEFMHLQIFTRCPTFS